MTSPSRPVLLETAPDPYTAEVLVGFLQAEGIPAFVRGAGLEDEFAAAQRAMHAIGCDVFVPEDRVEAARKVIESGRQANRLHERGKAAPRRHDPPRD